MIFPANTRKRAARLYPINSLTIRLNLSGFSKNMKWFPPSSSSKISICAPLICRAVHSSDFQGTALTRPPTARVGSVILRDHIAPVLKGVIKHEGGGVLSGHAEVALKDPLLEILRAILCQHTADERAGGLFAVGPRQGIACVIGGLRAKKMSGRRPLFQPASRRGSR